MSNKIIHGSKNMLYKFSLDLITGRCKSKGLSYREVEEMTGVPRMTIHRLFTKGDLPSIRHLIMLCEGLEISPRSLFTKAE